MLGMFRRQALVAGIVGLPLLVACQGQMRDQIDFRAQKSPLPVPPDSVAMNDQAVNLDYPLGQTGGPANPTASDIAATLALGQEKYDAQCAPCHGQSGRGDGLVGQALIVPPPDLTAARFAAMSDGQMYLRIVLGGASGGQVMPSYAKKLTDLERWAVVNYVKQAIAGHPKGPLPVASGSLSPFGPAPGVTTTRR